MVGIKRIPGLMTAPPGTSSLETDGLIATVEFVMMRCARLLAFVSSIEAAWPGDPAGEVDAAGGTGVEVGEGVALAGGDELRTPYHDCRRSAQRLCWREADGQQNHSSHGWHNDKPIARWFPSTFWASRR